MPTAVVDLRLGYVYVQGLVGSGATAGSATMDTTPRTNRPDLRDLGLDLDFLCFYGFEGFAPYREIASVGTNDVEPY